MRFAAVAGPDLGKRLARQNPLTDRRSRRRQHACGRADDLGGGGEPCDLRLRRSERGIERRFVGPARCGLRQRPLRPCRGQQPSGFGTMQPGDHLAPADPLAGGHEHLRDRARQDGDDGEALAGEHEDALADDGAVDRPQGAPGHRHDQDGGEEETTEPLVGRVRP